MSRKKVVLTIDGTQYRVTQVGMETADVLLFRVGQAMAAALTGPTPVGTDMVLGSIVKMIRHLSIEDFVWLRNEMKRCTEVGIVDVVGDKRITFTPLEPIYNDHFAGKHMAAFEWLKGALETNFGDFFGAIRQRVSAVSGVGSDSLHHPEVDGSSGVSSSATG